MNGNLPSNDVLALLAIAVGVLGCFFGYRILKVMLGVMGFIAGAAGGWQAGLAFAPGNTGVAAIVALICGIIGAVLCIWLFFLGIFLLGASSGAIVANALFGTGTSQPQPLIILGFAIVFGIVAILIQKFMIILSTAFSGAYLIAAGVLHFMAGTKDPFSLGGSFLGASGRTGYIGLACWIILGLVGVSVQYRGGRKEEPVKPAE